MTNVGPSDLQFNLGDDRRSPVWLRIKEQIEKRIAGFHKQLEQDMPPDQTAVLRGRIRSLRDVLKFGEELPPVQ